MSDESQVTNQELSSEQTELVAKLKESLARDRSKIGLDAVPIEGDLDTVARKGDGVPHDRDSVALALRFLVGLLAIGGDEAARRLQEMQRKLDADPSLWQAQVSGGQKSLRRQTWHFGVGLMKRGQRRLRTGIRRSYERSLRAMDRLSSTPGFRGAGLLARPVRRPLESQVLRWRREAALMEQEGELEELQGRALATGTLGALIVEIMDEIAANPELLAFVQDLLSQQGRGMATSVVDNTRSVTLTADDAADALLRWLLRRRPQRELPPTPVEGQRQTMYEPTVRVEGGAPDGE
ncbi:MAG: hypothetical protein PVF77_06460 [Anaerolineae bacterium]|jgi:hypothetical protein